MTSVPLKPNPGVVRAAFREFSILTSFSLTWISTTKVRLYLQVPFLYFGGLVVLGIEPRAHTSGLLNISK